MLSIPPSADRRVDEPGSAPGARLGAQVTPVAKGNPMHKQICVNLAVKDLDGHIGELAHMVAPSEG